MSIAKRFIATFMLLVSMLSIVGFVQVSASEELSAPTVTLKTNKAGNPQVTWKAVSGADGYKVYRKYGNQTNYKLVKTTTKLKFSDTKIVKLLDGSDETVKYMVRAYVKDEKGKTVLGEKSSAKEWRAAATETTTGSSADSNSPTVYVSNSGKYHKKSNCSGMKNFFTMTLDEAKSAGYEACKKCYK